MLELKKNKDYVDEVHRRLKQRNPYLYSKVKKKHINGVIGYVTRNMCMTMLRGENIYIHRFISIYITPRIKWKREYKKLKNDPKAVRIL